MKALRYDAGKPRMELIPSNVLFKLAEVFTYGAKKYTTKQRTGDYNYFVGDGLSWSRVYGAAQRHLNTWWIGVDMDEESGCNHLDMAIANLMMLRDLQLHNKTKDGNRQCRRL